ncbi:MAG: SpoIIE family protein phosphatase [Planctomycetota bacterium]|jgi:phosphoserine phosphatase
MGPEAEATTADMTPVPTSLLALRGEQARMWNVLLDFSRSMARALDIETVLTEIVETAAVMTCSRRVSLMLPDERNEHLRIVKAIGFDEKTRAEVRLPIGDAVAGRAFQSGRRLTTAGADRDRGAAYRGESFVSMPIKAASLKRAEMSVGVLNITNRYGDRPFEEWELEFIDLLGGIAGSVIDDTLWRRARDSLLKYERDLQVARLTTDDAERAVLLLADATGHGIGPALSVTQVRAMLRMAVRTEATLDRIVDSLNEQLRADLPRGRFVTAWFGVLDVARSTLLSYSAGQGPVLHHRAADGDVEQLPADTVPLGVIDDLPVDLPDPFTLAPGDVVAILSDGLFDAENERGEPFGPDRAAETLRRHAHEPAEAILDAMRARLDEFVGATPASDDRTAIIVRRAAA